MTKITTIVVLFALLTFFVAQPAHAQVKLAGMSASTFTPNPSELKVDHRAKILKAFLEKKKSPLADHADTFIQTADTYKLDWKLVAAIAGLESGFGNAIPAGSYNGWGWGIYGTNVHYFSSWDDGIQTVSKGLRENYIGEGNDADMYAIGSKYAASPTWAVRVINFMNQIDAFATEYEHSANPKALSLSI